MKNVCRILLALLLFGCASERALDWTYEIPATLERPNTVVIARIRQGGCDDEDLVIYDARPSSPRAGAVALPVLEQGVVYCFEIRLEDEMCTEFARSFERVEVDGNEMPTVHSVLASGTDVPCSNGLCDPEQGCRPCTVGTTFCTTGAPRCCSTVVASCDPGDAFLCVSFE